MSEERIREESNKQHATHHQKQHNNKKRPQRHQKIILEMEQSVFNFYHNEYKKLNFEHIKTGQKTLNFDQFLNLVFKNYEELEESFGAKKLHPMDLKVSVSKYINELLKPVRDHFENNAEAKKLYDKVKSYKVTK